MQEKNSVKKETKRRTFFIICAFGFFVGYKGPGLVCDKTPKELAILESELTIAKDEGQVEQAATDSLIVSLKEDQKKRAIWSDSISIVLGISVQEVDKLRNLIASEFGLVLVHPDEYLWNIADRFLHNPYKWVELYAWNVPTIGKNPDLIHPFTQLLLPPDSLIWEVKLRDLSARYGWVIEYFYKDSVYNTSISVGFNGPGNIKYALNALDLEKARTWRCNTYGGFGMPILDSEFGSRNFHIDNTPRAHRYLDDKSFFGVNYVNRDKIPESGLPRFIPGRLFWVPR